MRSAADAAPSHLYVPGLPVPGETIDLPQDEGRYLRRVCRARVGDLATATDGAGKVSTVRVTSFTERVRVTVESEAQFVRRCHAWVLCGAPEGQRADWLVEKLGELGVSVLLPVGFERGSWERRADRWERLRRLAVAALRQSRRAWLMEIKPVLCLADALTELPPGVRGQVALAEWTPAEALGSPGESGPGAFTLAAVEVAAVGPSAGFTDAEIAFLIGRGFSPIRLSDARLRTETAAVAWAASWSVRHAGGSD